MATDIFEPLETKRLWLRCVRRKDEAAIACLMTAEVSRWVADWPVPFTRNQAIKRIETTRRLALAGDALPFAVIAKASGALLGWVMLNRDEKNPRRASMGYWLGGSAPKTRLYA